MTDNCLARRMKDKPQNRGYFGNTKSRFYFEYRCNNPCEGDMCSRCLTMKIKTWEERGLKKRDPYREYYGLVTESIPEPFFDSDWYQSKVKEVGCPSESDMARAKKAQEEAKNNTVQVAVETKAVEPQKEKKKPGRKPKQTPTPPPVPPTPTPNPNPSPEPNPDPIPPPPKPAGKRRAKTQPVVEKPRESIKQVQAVEVSPSLEEIEVYKIIVRPFSHNDTSYFRDVKKNKLYSVGKDKRPSTYVGRWDPESEIIDKDFPDSDAE